MQKTIILSEGPNKLIQDVTIIWWSTWCMLKRLSEISDPIDTLIASCQVQVRNLTATQKLVVTRMETFLLPMAKSQSFLEVWQYATASIVPFCLWKFRNTLRETAESNEVALSTRHISKVLYEDFTTKRYCGETQIFNDNVVIGAKKDTRPRQ